MLSLSKVKLSESSLSTLLTLQRICLPGDTPLQPCQADENWWILRVEGEAAGFLAIKDLGNGKCYLSRAGVLSRYEGKGYYRLMLRGALRYCKRKGFTSCITDCTNWNIGSARGLMAVGFKPYWPAYQWALPNSIYWTKELA